MNIRKLLREKIVLLREELEREYLNQAKKDFESEFDSFLQEDAECSVQIKHKKQKTKVKVRAKKIFQGFTKPEDFVPIVRNILADGPKSKNDVAIEIIQMGILNKLDLVRHTDGKFRFYKSLDRTRRLMLDELQPRPDGLWALKVAVTT